MDDDTAFMQLVLSNAQGELSPLERGMHALAAATEKHSKNGKSFAAYARAVGVEPNTLESWVNAAEVYHNLRQHTVSVSDLDKRTFHLRSIHSAPPACWQYLVERMVKEKWNQDQTIAVVKFVNAIKPPRGYEKLFAVEKLQEMAAAGQDPSEVTRLAVRAIERARADIRDVQFAVEEFSTRFETWLVEHAWARIFELTHSAYRYTLWM